MKVVKLSVIIPCYNDGHYLPDAVNSVLACNDDAIEIIIVNDGSTDKNTLDVLKNYELQGIKVLSHSNMGLGFTRNRGIKEAKGKYILPLDADNKIKPAYIKESIPLLDAGAYDIIYSKPSFFGEDILTRKFETHEFEGYNLFTYNYIDACAVYCKYVWEKTGGYDEKMPIQGNEDWEFWLNSFLSGFKFKFLDKELYEYRITSSSMISKVSAETTENNKDYMLMKHKRHVIRLLQDGLRYQKFHEKDQINYLRTSVKYFVKFLKQVISFK